MSASKKLKILHLASSFLNLGRSCHGKLIKFKKHLRLKPKSSCLIKNVWLHYFAFGGRRNWGAQRARSPPLCHKFCMLSATSAYTETFAREDDPECMCSHFLNASYTSLLTMHAHIMFPTSSTRIKMMFAVMKSALKMFALKMFADKMLGDVFAKKYSL